MARLKCRHQQKNLLIKYPLKFSCSIIYCRIRSLNFWEINNVLILLHVNLTNMPLFNWSSLKNYILIPNDYTRENRKKKVYRKFASGTKNRLSVNNFSDKKKKHFSEKKSLVKNFSTFSSFAPIQLFSSNLSSSRVSINEGT